MKKILTALIVLAAMSACYDIFVPDISGKRVTVVAPADETEITEGKVAFLWNALDGSDRYRVTILENATLAVKDTVLYRDSLSMSFGFELDLSPANYRWSVQAFNKTYESAKSVYGLTVVPKPVPPEPVDTDISNKSVAVVAPVDMAEIMEGTVPFRWNELQGADRYRITVVSPDFENAGLVVLDKVVYHDSLEMSYGFEIELVPGDFQWSVQAFNATYESVRSVYDLKIKSKKPDDPVIPDISGKRVTIVAPVDMAEITEGTVSFRWNELEGADRYRVTVVSPDFEHAGLVVLDKVVYRDSLEMSYGFEVELSPGDYQWSVQAFNATYESTRSVYDLKVKSKEPDDPVIPDISGKRVVVVAPVDGTEITEGTVSFRWNELQGAERYRVTIVSPDFERAGLVILDRVVYRDSLAMSYGFEIELAPGDYQWSVQAFNATYESTRSVYDLKVKSKGPDDPIVPDISGKRVTIVAPVDGTEITEGTVSFRWNELNGADRYRVTVVSPDFEHASLVVKDAVIYRDPLEMSYGFEIELAPGNYQWSVQAFNATYESTRSVYGLIVVPGQ